MVAGVKRSTSAPPTAKVPPVSDSLVVRTLLAAARQRPDLDEGRCRLVLDWLRTAAAVRTALQESLARHRLTELKFSILVVLFTLEPESSTAADLAVHAGVTRAAITGALDGLQEQSLVTRQRDTADRRSLNVHLTDAGHQVIEAALQRYLRTAGNIARFVKSTEQAAASTVCARLSFGAGGIA